MSRGSPWTGTSPACPGTASGRMAHAISCREEQDHGVVEYDHFVDQDHGVVDEDHDVVDQDQGGPSAEDNAAVPIQEGDGGGGLQSVGAAVWLHTNSLWNFIECIYLYVRLLL